jgi:hypothetical protein
MHRSGTAAYFAAPTYHVFRRKMNVILNGYILTGNARNAKRVGSAFFIVRWGIGCQDFIVFDFKLHEAGDTASILFI